MEKIIMLKEWILDNPFEFVFILLGILLFIRFFRIILNVVVLIISLIFDIFRILFIFMMVSFYNYLCEKIANKTINDFEKSINNEGIKKDIDVSACHTYFNRLGANGIEFLIELYQEKISREIDNDECDNEQIERYNYLMEIMSRSLYYNKINKT